MPNLIIAETRIHQDIEGRYSLNDLHRASGGEKRHGSSYWLANQQTKDLIAELESETAGIPVVTLEGRNGGTYVAKELVYAYAMWISPAFHLKVIRGYDTSINPAKPAPSTKALKADMLFLREAGEILRLSETSKLRGLKAIAANHGLSTNILPDYSDEKLTRALGDLLREHGSKLSAVKANPILFDLGYLERLDRRASKGQTKEFWSITEKGSRYGKNETAPANPNETQPRWYVDRFGELLGEIDAHVAGQGKPALRVVGKDGVGEGTQ